MEMKFKCLMLFLQISCLFAQGNGGFEGFENGDFGGFSLIQKDLNLDGAGSNETTSNDTSTDHTGGEQQLLFQPGQQFMADQPQQGEVAPTRLPNPAGASTPPPLVRQEGNATVNATTAKPAPTEAPKSKGEGGGSAEFIANLALVLGGACVLHLLY